MQAVMEKPALVDATELAATTVEAVTDFLKTTAETPPPLAAAEPSVTDEQVTFIKGHWVNAKGYGKLNLWNAVTGPLESGGVTLPVSTDETLHAATQWCAPPAASWILPGDLHGVPGNGLADSPAKLNSSGLVTTAEVADFLDWCALRIERQGWVQHTLNYQDRVCAMGAVQARFHDARAQMNEKRAYNLSQTAARHLRHHLGCPIESWNDAPGRTMQEVMTAFREAATELRSHVDPSMHPGDLRQAPPSARLVA